jgi:hypothetical protein
VVAAADRVSLRELPVDDVVRGCDDLLSCISGRESELQRRNAWAPGRLEQSDAHVR